MKGSETQMGKDTGHHSLKTNSVPERLSALLLYQLTAP